MRRNTGMAVVLALVLSFFCLAPGGARAESDEPAGTASDDGIAPWTVARLKTIDGSAWVLSPGESDWNEVDGNAPLPKGGRVRVSDDASAEIELSSGDRIRILQGGDIELRDLREDRASMTLYEGEARFTLPADDFFIPVNVTLADGQIVRFPKTGRYAIKAAGTGGESVVQVREGEARIKVEEGKYRVRAGEEAFVKEGVSIGLIAASDADADADYPQVDQAPPELSGVEASVEAPPEVVTELSDYGEWVNAPAYGAIWRPRVAVGWSPYTYGRWLWVSPFGWSWVSSEPWGWYPYRCGNWVNDPFFGWCWTPQRAFISISLGFGHHGYRPARFYPATVRFVRDSGNVRWLPLSPGERFTRSGVPRNERGLTTWRQSLPKQTIFVREQRGRANEAPKWRDANVDRPARPPAMRPAPVVRSAPLVPPAPADRPPRSVRPKALPRGDYEGIRPAPPVRQRPVPSIPSRERPEAGSAPRPEVRPAPAERSVPRPEGRPAPERFVPRPAPPEREPVQRFEPRDRQPRDDDRDRGGGGARENDRGWRSGK